MNTTAPEAQTNQFERVFVIKRSTQTIIEGKAIKVLTGDEIKLTLYTVNPTDSDPVSADLYLREELVGHLDLNQLKDLFTELDIYTTVESFKKF